MEARSDDFHTPKPRKAAAKTVVNAVLGTVSSLGTSLLSLLSGLLAAALILYSGYVLYDTFYTQQNARSGWDLLQYKPVILEDEPAPKAGENRLAAINSDYRAWLTVYDTGIDYPVMQGPDDLYYASHDIYKQTSLTGAIYLAAGNSGDIADSYSLMYGHHMDNGAMFGALDRYWEGGYFAGHREGILVSRSSVYDLNAFAVATTDAYQSRIYSVGNRKADVLAFLRANVTGAPDTGDNWSDDTEVTILDESALNLADSQYKVVALSTCAAASGTNGRLVVFYTAVQRNLITVSVKDKAWTYDGKSHTSLKDIGFETNYPGDAEHPTTVEYSLDGGKTWHTWEEKDPPVVNVKDSTEMLVRVTNDLYGRQVSDPIKITVKPRPVEVIADADQHKVYGQDDPQLTATVENLVGNDTVKYKVRRPGKGTDEDAGTYVDAVEPYGEKDQGNYTVKYVKANFVVQQAPNLTVAVTGFDGEYDGQVHKVVAKANIPEGTVIEYSLDGKTWTREAPFLQDVGEQRVMVRATNPNYETDITVTKLRVTPKPVTVKANPVSKVYDKDDPEEFTATVTGLVGDDTIEYTVTRPGAGKDEDVKTYKGAIVASGEREQGNYVVTYESADFTITPPDQLYLTVSDCDAVYDGKEHAPVVSTNMDDPDTVIEFSTDGGQTWQKWTDDNYPSITDAGQQTVMIRATNPGYDPFTTTITMKIDPAQVTVRVHNSSKVYLQDDPESYETTVTGLIGDDTIDFVVTRPDADQQQDVGVYPGAIVAQGEERQGNYIVTYVPGDFEIALDTGMTLKVDVFDGVYDGQEHAVLAQVVTADPEKDKDTVIEYSTDGGQTWTTEPPSLTDAGTLTVLIRATNPDYVSTETEVVLNIRPRQVVVSVGNYSKVSGTDDPKYEVTVEGLLDGDEIAYSVAREEGEDPASYAITPTGEERQGNYVVVYQSGTLWIIDNQNKATPTTTPGTEMTPGGTIDTPEPEEIEDDDPPLAKVIKLFNPRGAEHEVWALANLLCLVVTIYLFIPLLHLGAKFGRARLMRKINRYKRQMLRLQKLNEEDSRDKNRMEQLVFEARKKLAEAQTDAMLAQGPIQEAEYDKAVETLFYNTKRFLRRFRLGTLLELICAALAVVVFLLTENMRLPMVLIDQWTPVMLVLMLTILVLDMRFIRYQGKVLADEEEAERRRLAKEQAAMGAAHK